MFAIVVLLGFEHSLHLIGYRVVWIVAKVGRNLIGGGKERRACPTRHVEDLLIRCLLRHLDWINGAHYQEPRQSWSASST